MKCSAFLALAVSALVLAGSAGAGVNVWFVADGKPVSVPRNGTTLQKAVRAAARRADRGRAPPWHPLGRSARDPAALDHRHPSRRHRRPGRALRGRPRRPAAPGARRPARPHPSRHSRASAGCRCSSTEACRSASSPATTSESRWRPRSSRPSSTSSSTRDIQQRLIDLGFMAPSGLTGTVDTQTSTAVLGFEKWANLPRDGVLGASTLDHARAGNAARAPVADARPPDRGAASPPARAPDRGQPRRARRPHLVGVGREDADRVVPRLSQGALLVVGAVQGLAAVGELLHGRHRLPRVPGRSRRTRHLMAACA